jgi:acyl-CoA thioester hydrolase
MESEGYKLEFEARDYECDLSGIVNNEVFQNYLEHTRTGS